MTTSCFYVGAFLMQDNGEKRSEVNKPHQLVDTELACVRLSLFTVQLDNSPAICLHLIGGK